MLNIDLISLIQKTILDNTNETNDNSSVHFRTHDKVFIDDEPYFREIGLYRRMLHTATDYAVMNGAMLNVEYKKKYCWQWTRSATQDYSVFEIESSGNIEQGLVFETKNTIRPVMSLSLHNVHSLMKTNKDLFKIKPSIDDYGNVRYHTMEFGEYPKTYVGDALNMELENNYTALQNQQATTLIPTGKQYTGCHDKNGGYFDYNNEYDYKGQRYVRVLCVTVDEDSEFKDGTKAPEFGSPCWAKVEPITWIIRNWDDLPEEINPDGLDDISTTPETIIEIEAEEGIVAGIPFYPNNQDDFRTMWQNSTIRGYLNGYNLSDIKANGYKSVKHVATNGGDFTEHNFLTEALTFAPTPVATQQTEDVFHSVVDRLKRKGYGIKVQETPMSVKDQIKFYIDNGKSFMLHGPSGIGKTRRIEEADPDFVSIVLRNGILPEEVIGKTIYPNNDKTQAGTWVPPAWYADLCEKCEREPDKQHVLFIDEITNVKPSEQSLVFHLVLNNSIGPNVGPLPENTVVVAAGNSKEESDAAYNMPEPLFRRFDGHIELKPDIQLWLEWGSEPSLEDNSRPKVHPLVANFVGTYGSNVFYSPYDSEEPPKFAIDPRGWEQVSDIIYDNNGLIAKELIENKVGNEIATSFIAFAKTPPLMLEDILEDNYDSEDIPSTFDAKYALALSLRNASIEQIEQVREFIGRNLGSEILAMFDVAWVGNDDEKAIYLAGLPTLQELPSSNPNVTELTPNLDEEDFKASIRNAVNTWKNYLKNHPNMEK